MPSTSIKRGWNRGIDDPNAMTIRTAPARQAPSNDSSAPLAHQEPQQRMEARTISLGGLVIEEGAPKNRTGIGFTLVDASKEVVSHWLPVIKNKFDGKPTNSLQEFQVVVEINAYKQLTEEEGFQAASIGIVKQRIDPRNFKVVWKYILNELAYNGYYIKDTNATIPTPTHEKEQEPETGETNTIKVGSFIIERGAPSRKSVVFNPLYRAIRKAVEKKTDVWMSLIEAKFQGLPVDTNKLLGSDVLMRAFKMRDAALLNQIVNADFKITQKIADNIWEFVKDSLAARGYYIKGEKYEHGGGVFGNAGITTMDPFGEPPK